MSDEMGLVTVKSVTKHSFVCVFGPVVVRSSGDYFLFVGAAALARSSASARL
jgi:hypothetical protein